MPTVNYAGALLFISLIVVGGDKADAAPTRLFIQEEGRLAPSRAVFIDVLNNTGDWVPAAESELRIGLPLAEAILGAHGLGVKFALPNDWVPYVIGNLGTAPSTLDFRIGAAYLWRTPGIDINFNPGVSRVSRETVFNFNGAVFLPLNSADWLGGLSVGGEFLLTSADNTSTGLAVGLRWAPRDWLTADVMLGGAGGKVGNGAVRTPAALRVNVQF